MERLYRELFAQYTEFKEADVMLQDRILTYSEEAAKEATKKAELKKAFDVAKKMLERGVALSEIAEIVELPIDTLQPLVPNS
jgi:hypothetical protein